MIKDIIYETILFITGLCILTACDRNSNVQAPNFKLNCNINGEKYIDQMPIFLPPGVKRTPYVDLTLSGKRYMQFYSSLQRSSQEGQERFMLIFFIPIDKDFILKKKHEFQIGENELINFNHSGHLKELSQYVVIRSSNDEIWYSGEGTVEFTEFDINTLIAKGKCTFNFPYPPSFKERENLQLYGKFECLINIIN